MSAFSRLKLYFTNPLYVWRRGHTPFVDEFAEEYKKLGDAGKNAEETLGVVRERYKDAKKAYGRLILIGVIIFILLMLYVFGIDVELRIFSLQLSELGKLREVMLLALAYVNVHGVVLYVVMDTLRRCIRLVKQNEYGDGYETVITAGYDEQMGVVMYVFAEYAKSFPIGWKGKRAFIIFYLLLIIYILGGLLIWFYINYIMIIDIIIDPSYGIEFSIFVTIVTILANLFSFYIMCFLIFPHRHFRTDILEALARNKGETDIQKVLEGLKVDRRRYSDK